MILIVLAAVAFLVGVAILGGAAMEWAFGDSE